MAETVLEMSRRHVREAESIIARQERLIASMRRHHQSTNHAVVLLETYLLTLAEFRAHKNLHEQMAAKGDGH